MSQRLGAYSLADADADEPGAFVVSPRVTPRCLLHPEVAMSVTVAKMRIVIGKLG
jgi:hypothetical protein